MKRSSLFLAVAMAAGISAMSVARFSLGTGRIDPRKPSGGRSRSAKQSPAKRVMKKAQARRQKGGA